jgi:hypothetical protein
MAAKNALTVLKTVFSTPKYLFRWLVYSMIASVLMAIPTALIPNPFINFVRMTPAVPLDYVLLMITGLMMGAYFTLHGYQNRPDANPKKHFLMFGGGYMGFIAFACPVCEVFLVTLFGASFLLTYFEPIRHEFGILAVLVMALGVFLKARQLSHCQTC